MNISKVIVIFIGASLLNNVVLSQNNPPKPSFDYVTIDISTGQPQLYWTPSTLINDPRFYSTTGYIIYRFIPELNISDSIDIVPANFTPPYIDVNNNGNIQQVGYRIAAYHLNGPIYRKSEIVPTFPYAQKSIYVTSSFDSCYSEINLEWLKNEIWGNRIDSSFIYFNNVGSNGPYQFLARIPGSLNSYRFKCEENLSYYFYVESRHRDYGFISRSNFNQISTQIAIRPAFINITSIIAKDNGNRIEFEVDPNTELRKYKIARWENFDSSKSIFSAENDLYSFASPLTSAYLDNANSWTARTRPFYYKLDAYFACDTNKNGTQIDTVYKLVNVSNLPNSIILKVYAKERYNEIEWTPFIDAYSNSGTREPNTANRVTYNLIRRIESPTLGIDSMLIYTETTSNINTNINFKYVDNIKPLEWQGYYQEFCYIIEAIEQDLNGNQLMYSQSRKVCTEVVPGVVMPDAIKPNDPTVVNGHARNLFVPFINFESNYTLYIYNRWGELIFEGENQGWNGKLPSGEYVKEGAYVYRLVIHTIGNRDVIKVGNVTVVY